MLDLAEALDPLFEPRQERLEDGLEDDEDVAETTLQLVFFDGEEAFKDWTDTDSIYGARLVKVHFSSSNKLKIFLGTWQKSGPQLTSIQTANADYFTTPLLRKCPPSST